MISNFDLNFAHNPMPAAPWRQFQISLATVGWQARFDSHLGDFIEDKPVGGWAMLWMDLKLGWQSLGPTSNFGCRIFVVFAMVRFLERASLTWPFRWWPAMMFVNV